MLDFLPLPPGIREGGFNTVVNAIAILMTFLSLIALAYPWFGLGLGLVSFVFLAVMTWQVANFVGWLWFRIKAIFNGIFDANLFESEILPSAHERKMGDGDRRLVAFCRAKIGATKGHDGYLTLSSQQLIFTSSFRLNRIYYQSIDLGQITSVRLDRRHPLWLALDVAYKADDKDRQALFLFFDNRKALAQKFGSALNARVLR
jgi:hypothetical protein